MLSSFFFDHTAPADIYTLSLHDALPIFHIMNYRARAAGGHLEVKSPRRGGTRIICYLPEDRKSTRLNSSHQITSYAAFCLERNNRNECMRVADGTVATYVAQP